MSLNFPDGVISSRKFEAKVDVNDTEAVVAYAKAHGYADWIRTKEEVAKKALAGLFDLDAESGVVKMPETGEPIAGLVVVPGGVSTSIRIVE